MWALVIAILFGAYIITIPCGSIISHYVINYVLVGIKNALIDFMSNSCVYGARMDGKSKQINSYKCQMDEHQHLLQTLAFNFI